jgi:NTP pyrophosphatase (non-canonical NTP hydrolase)
MTKDEIQNGHREWEVANFGAPRPAPTPEQLDAALLETIAAALSGASDPLKIEEAVRHAFDLGKLVYAHVVPLLGMFEETGELAHAVLKQLQGIRGSYEDHEAKQRDALGDIELYRNSFASAKGWSISEIDAEVYDEVVERNWKENPADGSTKISSVPPEPARVEIVGKDSVLHVRVDQISRIVGGPLGGAIVHYHTQDDGHHTFHVPYQPEAALHTIALADAGAAERIRSASKAP